MNKNKWPKYIYWKDFFCQKVVYGHCECQAHGSRCLLLKMIRWLQVKNMILLSVYDKNLYVKCISCFLHLLSLLSFSPFRPEADSTNVLNLCCYCILYIVAVGKKPYLHILKERLTWSYYSYFWNLDIGGFHPTETIYAVLNLWGTRSPTS